MRLSDLLSTLLQNCSGKCLLFGFKESISLRNNKVTAKDIEMVLKTIDHQYVMFVLKKNMDRKDLKDTPKAFFLIFNNFEFFLA